MKSLKIYCFDLTKYNNEKLVDVLNIFAKDNNITIDIQSFLGLKKEKFVKVYIDIVSGKMVSATMKNNKDIRYTSGFRQLLESIEVTDITKIVPKVNKDINIDSILDKITSNGINSLTSYERSILGNMK